MPSEQPPPSCQPVSKGVMAVSWLPPDYPNGVIIRYAIYRNGTLLTNLTANGMLTD